MAANFEDLSEELVELIAAQITNKTDFLSLRIVSRNLHAKLLWRFGRTCLPTIETTLALSDLRRLRAIYKLRHLAHNVKTLVIKQNEPGLWGHGLAWRRRQQPASDALMKPFPAEFIELRKVLVESWTNCRSIVIRGSSEDGWSDLSNAITSTDAIGAMLDTVAQFGPTLHSFDIDLKHGQIHRLDLHYIDSSHFQQPAFQSAWAGLRKLCINVSLIPGMYKWVCDLVLYASNLQELNLNLDLSYSKGLIIQMLQVENLPKVHTLGLTTFRIRYADLSKFLLRFDHCLQSLSLQCIILQDYGGNWQDLFALMRESMPLLRTLILGTLFQAPIRQHIFFDTLFDQKSSASETLDLQIMARKIYASVDRITAVKITGSTAEMKGVLRRLEIAAEKSCL